jgi:hypothetical protein
MQDKEIGRLRKIYMRLLMPSYAKVLTCLKLASERSDGTVLQGRVMK